LIFSSWEVLNFVELKILKVKNASRYRVTSQAYKWLLEPGYLPFKSWYMRLSDSFSSWFAYGLSPKEHTAIYKL
jgi:hypothetical protein